MNFNLFMSCHCLVPSAMASGTPVEIFLDKIGLQTYRTRLESQGYQTVFDLCLIEEEDLNLLNIRDPNDRAKILEAGK